MKRNLLFGIGLLLAGAVHAQLNIQSGATFYIESGATVTVQGDVTSGSNITGGGVLQMNGTSLQNLNMNGHVIPKLQISNSANVALGGAASIDTNLDLTAGNILLGANNLTIGNAATITGYDNSKYIVTGSTGQLLKVNLGTTAFEFPVGFDASTYNPLTVTQNGTAENIGVRVLQDALTAGTTGTAFVKEAVDASWVLTESVAGNNNLTLTSQWDGTDELPHFDRSRTGISNFDGTTWDMTNAMTGTASGSGPYTVSRSSIDTVGAFAVGTRPVLTPLLVAPKVFLQGAYNAGTGMMNANLLSLIPLTEPYSGMTSFTQKGSGGDESIPSSILASSGTGSDIVDWVFAELRDATTDTVITTRSVLLQRDGSLVDVDGTNTKTNYINFAGELPNNYYVRIRHRNHLGIRTPATLALTKTSATAYDFSTAQSQAYQDPTITTNSAMAQNGSVFMMWAGNINQDQYVRVTSQAFPPISSDAAYLLGTVLGGDPNATVTTYSVGDANMDGKVRATSLAFPPIPSDIAFILGSALGGDSNATRKEHN